MENPPDIAGNPSPSANRPASSGPDEPWEAFRERYSRLRLATLRQSTAKDSESRLDIAERILKPKTVGDVASKEALERLQAELLTGAGLEDQTELKPRSPHTVRSHMASVVAALTWSLDAVPRFEKLKTSKLRAMKGRPITVEEFERMLAAVPSVTGESAAPSWKYLLKGAWESGLRLEELMSLSWDDHSMLMPAWDRGPNPILLIPADLQKNDTDESIPILPGFESLLAETPTEDRTGWVFNPDSLNVKFGRQPVVGRPSAEWVGKVITRIGETARVVVTPENTRRKKKAKFASAHDLRRSLAERMAEAGLPPELLKKVMRHASVETTQRYYLNQNVQRDATKIRSLLAQKEQPAPGRTQVQAELDLT